MEAPDVVVTGIGMVTSLGATAAESGAAWRAGRCAARKHLEELSGTSLEDAEAAALPDFNAAERLGSRRMLKYMSEAAVLGCLAAREATQEADLRRRFKPERIGLYAATGLAAVSFKDVIPIVQASLDEQGRLSPRLLGERGLAAANPLLSFKILANMPPCLVSILEQVKGPNYIFTPWEGQAGAALVEGWLAVAQGEVDCALVGAADTPAHPATFVYLRQAGLLSEGEWPASGAAYLVMERARTARRDDQAARARIASMELQVSSAQHYDPLAERMGRSFAAAPAILTALACQNSPASVSICGADHWEFHVRAETPG